MTHQDIRLHSIASNAAAVGLGGKMARSFMCPSTFLNRQATIKAPGALNRFRWQVSRDGDHANQYGFIAGIALYPNAVKRFGVDKYKLDDLCAEELKWHLVAPVTSTETISSVVSRCFGVNHRRRSAEIMGVGFGVVSDARKRNERS